MSRLTDIDAEVAEETGGVVALFDTRTATSRTDASGGLALLLIVVVMSTLVLDAYAFNSFMRS